MSEWAKISSRQDGVWALNPLLDDRWVDLIACHPSASVFHTRGWLTALQASYGYEPVAFTTSSPTEPLTNALLFCKVRSWLTGGRLVSLPFSDHCEPLVENKGQFERLCVCAESFRQNEQWKYVEVRSVNTFLNFEPSFSRTSTHQLHRLDLRPSLEALRKSFHKDCIQRKIARAEREALRYEVGNTPQLVHQLYSLVQQTRSRHHLPPQPVEWFQHLIASMGKDVCIRIAYKNNQPIAGILTLNHRRKIVYKYGGSDTRFNSSGATPLLFWRAIIEAKEAGMTELDLGRSDLDNPGLIAFKERWSAVSSTLTTWRGPANNVFPTAEQLKVRLAKKLCGYLPDRLLTLVGRLLYRHIG